MAFLVTETNGTWGNAEQVPGIEAIDTGQDSDVTLVTCPSAGNCAAAGSTATSNGVSPVFHAVAVSEVNGTWGEATGVPGVATVNAPAVTLSCPPAGGC